MRRVELDGATAFVAGRHSVLVDCPEGCAAAWQQAGLPAMGPDAVCFTGGGWLQIAGLYGLLGSFGQQRQLPLRLLVDMRRQEVEILAGAFLRNEHAAVSVEADWPGEPLKVGPFTLQSRAVGEDLAWVVNGVEVTPR